MTSPRVRTIPANPHGRDFVVGDVHGCFRTLERAPAELRFEPHRLLAHSRSSGADLARVVPSGFELIPDLLGQTLTMCHERGLDVCPAVMGICRKRPAGCVCRAQDDVVSAHPDLGVQPRQGLDA